MKHDSSRLNSVEKALKILLAFQAEQPSWGVRELSVHLGFSPATAQRTLQTLKNYGFVDQDPETRQYRLGNIYFQFLDTLQSIYPITRTALPLMKRSSRITSTAVTARLNSGDNNSIFKIRSYPPKKAVIGVIPVLITSVNIMG